MPLANGTQFVSIYVVEVNEEETWLLLTQLWATMQHVRRGVDENPADPMTVRLLALAESRDGVRPSEIAEELEVAHPSVTRYVKQLEAAGYVTLVASEADARSYRVHPTRDGRKTLARFRARLIERFAPALEGWSPDEVTTMTTLMGRLNEAMSKLKKAQNTSGKTKNRWRTNS